MRSHPWLMPVLAALTLPMTIAASAHGRAETANVASSTTPAIGPQYQPGTEPVASRSAQPQVARHHVATRRPAPAMVHAVVRHATSSRGWTRPVRGRPVVSRHSAPRRPVTHAVGPTSWGALNDAIARIPSYRAGAARWVISSRYGHWGTADWYHDTIYVSPNVPTARLYDVAVHEWSHELSVRDYGGNVDAATAAMNAYFGGSGLTGAERAADCMAIEQGAQWTHYTGCGDNHWRTGATRLVHGGRL